MKPRSQAVLNELRHRHGYERRPVSRDEFSRWEQEQVWLGP